MDEQELDYEKQMDNFYTTTVEILKENMSGIDLKIVLERLDVYFRYKVEGVKIRMRLLKELYGYEPPMYISFEKALDILLQPSEQKSFKNKAITEAGKKGTFELLEEYIKRRS